MLGQGNTKGPDPLSSDQPMRMFGGDLSTEEQRRMVMTAYNKLKDTFEGLVKPDGSKNVPAKTCRDLHLAYPEKPSGEYWVDPNTGNPQDAILVYCDMARQATCVQPKPDSSPEMAIETTDREIWFSDIQDGGFQFTYKADSNQISFLQMLSSSASQNITYHCFNSLAYYSAKKDHYRKAVSLMSWNDLEIRGRGRLSYEAPVDDCQHETKEWAKTILSLKDTKPSRLPIVDVLVKDIGTVRQKFRLEIGPVCFV